jgi:hypothetical protein
MKKILLTLVLLASAASLRAQSFAYSVALDGPTEPSPSPGVGSGYVVYDSSARTLRIEGVFSGLVSPTTAAHLHAATASPFTGTAGVAVHSPSLSGFPLGVTSGAYTNTFDLTLPSSFNATYLASNGGTPATAEAALAAAMASGRVYWNIHTTAFPGGEIRGFLTPVPEPGSVALAGIGALALAARARQKRRDLRQ